MKEISYCGYCGKPIDGSKGYCPHCGKLIQKRYEQPKVYYKATERKCIYCATLLPAEAVFCGKCGADNTEQGDGQFPYCVICDELLPESANYCILCGTQYVEAEDGYVNIPSRINSVCHACGASLKTGMAFCIKCGAPVETAQKARVKRTVPSCHFCGIRIKVDVDYCEYCGKEIDRPTETTPVVDKNMGIYMRTPSTGDGRKCPSCGVYETNMERKSCWNCGTKYNNT